MRRLWRGFSRWGVREEPGWSGPLDVALTVLCVVAMVDGIVTGHMRAAAAIVVLALFSILDRAWRLGR